MERPTGFENEKMDCTVRALSIAANIPYEKAHQAWKTAGRKDGRKMFKTKYKFQWVCKMVGIEARQVRRSGSLNRFLKDFPTGRYFLLRRSHAFAVIDGIVHDNNGNSRILGAWELTNKL